MKSGDLLVAFDGNGNQAKAKIVEIKKREMLCQVIESGYDPGDLPGDVEVAVALPKGDRQKLIVERLVEMGIHRLIPLQTSAKCGGGYRRCHCTIATLRCGGEQAVGAQSTSKDRSRSDLFRVHSSLTATGSDPLGSSSLCAQRFDLSTLGRSVRVHDFAIAIGPEGGLTEREVDQPWIRVGSLSTWGLESCGWSRR